MKKVKSMDTRAKRTAAILGMALVLGCDEEPRSKPVPIAIQTTEATTKAIYANDAGQTLDYVKDLPVWWYENKNRRVISITAIGTDAYGKTSGYWVLSEPASR